MITFAEMNHVVCKNTYNSSSLMHTKKKLEILAASKHELFVHVYGFFLFFIANYQRFLVKHHKISVSRTLS